jgi:hypothetical protein
MTLDQSMLALIAKHGLLNISITAHSSGDHFSVSVQWEGGDIEGRGCALESGKAITEALSRALADMNKQRPAELVGELAP